MKKLGVLATAVGLCLSTFAYAANSLTKSETYKYVATTPAGSTISYNQPPDVYAVRLSYEEVAACKGMTGNLYVRNNGDEPGRRASASLQISTGTSLLHYVDVEGNRPKTALSSHPDYFNEGTSVISTHYEDGRNFGYSAEAATPPFPGRDGPNKLVYAPSLLRGLEKDPAYQTATHKLDECSEILLGVNARLRLQAKLVVLMLPEDRP
jgi:hypothetical protein